MDELYNLKIKYKEQLQKTKEAKQKAEYTKFVALHRRANFESKINQWNLLLDNTKSVNNKLEDFVNKYLSLQEKLNMKELERNKVLEETSENSRHLFTEFDHLKLTTGIKSTDEQIQYYEELLNNLKQKNKILEDVMNKSDDTETINIQKFLEQLQCTSLQHFRGAIE